MPIRFRCTYCSRLLGIARRKAGTQIRCPQCSESITVPIQDDVGDLDELDNLLGSHSRENGKPAGSDLPIPEYSAPSAASAMEDLPAPESARPVATPSRLPAIPPKTKSAQAPAPPRPQRHRKSGDEEPLLLEDVDELLGIDRAGEPLELDDKPSPRVKPVSGMDANSLGASPGKLVLSPQKATLLMIAVVILIGLAFTAGFLIGSRL